MAREMKFRAWDKETKTMLFDAGHGGQLSAVTLNELLYGEEKIFTQYTGLCDKNKKEIYEGDIVSMFSGTQKSAVVWDNAGCWSVVAQLSGGSLPDDQLLSNMLGTLEIIGNIYENPELLK